MIRFLFLDYWLRRFKEWLRKHEPDPESMTKTERSEEVEWLIDRANELCDADQVPGVYIRIGKQKYAELVQQDKTIDRTHH